MSQEESQPSEPSLPLEPFFTLLTNSSTGATIHPRVRYIFADDDDQHSAILDTDADTRSVVVDLAPSSDGTSWAVASASSLSPDFAVTDSLLSTQRQDGDASSTMMLRLEGVEREPVESPDEGEAGSGSSSVRADADALAEEFKKRMGTLRRVVAEAEKRDKHDEEAVVG